MCSVVILCLSSGVFVSKLSLESIKTTEELFCPLKRLWSRVSLVSRQEKPSSHENLIDSDMEDDRLRVNCRYRENVQ